MNKAVLIIFCIFLLSCTNPSDNQLETVLTEDTPPQESPADPLVAEDDFRFIAGDADSRVYNGK